MSNPNFIQYFKISIFNKTNTAASTTNLTALMTNYVVNCYMSSS